MFFSFLTVKIPDESVKNWTVNSNISRLSFILRNCGIKQQQEQQQQNETKTNKKPRTIKKNPKSPNNNTQTAQKNPENKTKQKPHTQ